MENKKGYVGIPVFMPDVVQILPKRDADGNIITGQPGFGWEISEEALRDIKKIEKHLIRG